jgi:hypothetical protein
VPGTKELKKRYGANRESTRFFGTRLACERLCLVPDTPSPARSLPLRSIESTICTYQLCSC